jgi:hypothetical protein
MKTTSSSATNLAFYDSSPKYPICAETVTNAEITPIPIQPSKAETQAIRNGHLWILYDVE